MLDEIRVFFLRSAPPTRLLDKALGALTGPLRKASRSQRLQGCARAGPGLRELHSSIRIQIP